MIYATMILSREDLSRLRPWGRERGGGNLGKGFSWAPAATKLFVRPPDYQTSQNVSL